MLYYINSYLKIRKQCVTVNSIKSTFEEIILVVPPESIVVPILLNIFFNNFFHFILISSAPNLAFDNTFPSFSKTIENIFSIQESGSEKAITGLKIIT